MHASTSGTPPRCVTIPSGPVSRTTADAFEAIVAAVYLDGGFQAAWDLVERLLTERINAAEIKNFYDFKTRLQRTAQARLKATPTYRVVQELGPITTSASSSR